MRLHYALLEAVVETVHTIFKDAKMADKAIQATLKSNKKWGSRDRAFIAKYSYEIVRWWRLLHHINQSEISDCHRQVIWRILGITLYLTDIEIGQEQGFKGLNHSTIRKRFDEAQKSRVLRESMPDWLDEMMVDELGSAWDRLSHAMNLSAPLTIRINTSKTTYGELKKLLEKDNVDLIPIDGMHNAAHIRERINLFGLEIFQKGYFEVQDGGSQLIAPFLDVKPGMRVIDACAGAGGKTLQLSNLMENKGTIIAMDTEEWKLEELKKRAKRNGAHNIDCRLIAGKTIKRLRASADAVLLDVPCSGLGVLRRNPDAKWKLKPEFVQEIKEKQTQILNTYATMVKPGGKLVYATCSILPSENEKQVQLFLEKNSEYNFIKDYRTSPPDDGFDGFYMALMERK